MIGVKKKMPKPQLNRNSLKIKGGNSDSMVTNNLQSNSVIRTQNTYVNEDEHSSQYGSHSCFTSLTMQVVLSLGTTTDMLPIRLIF